MAVSAACVVHCAVVPVALVAVPTLASQWERVEEPLVWAFLALGVAGAAVALVGGFIRHRHPFPLLAGWGGLAVLVAAEQWDGPVLAAVVGGVSLAVAHAVNRRLVKSWAACPCPGCRDTRSGR